MLFLLLSYCCGCYFAAVAGALLLLLLWLSVERKNFLIKFPYPKGGRTTFFFMNSLSPAVESFADKFAYSS